MKKDKIACQQSSFFYSAFFDDEFKKYNENIIESSKKGKKNEFDIIISLEREYKLVKLYSENAEYNHLYLYI